MLTLPEATGHPTPGPVPEAGTSQSRQPPTRWAFPLQEPCPDSPSLTETRGCTAHGVGRRGVGERICPQNPDSACFTLDMSLEPSSGWFAVRCLFRTNWPPSDDSFHVTAMRSRSRSGGPAARRRQRTCRCPDWLSCGVSVLKLLRSGGVASLPHRPQSRPFTPRKSRPFPPVSRCLSGLGATASWRSGGRLIGNPTFRAVAQCTTVSRPPPPSAKR